MGSVMKKISVVLGLTTLIFFFAFGNIFAQFYLGPYIGIKSSGLKGAIKLVQNGQVSTGNVAAETWFILASRSSA